ncbi:ATP-grasp domain-containing protein [Nesterenkonia natronophila]|uniref:ATP-grasp domain-containing protein n=1 Tax=Nesterenkonia natronophila TaxID=2174932 RepID=A0A3A4F1B2_9MICC|nr:ATP-grasp domain-containing protein [Nesterenkonia natronophila]RJN31598.1 ATP-grasp domain-containing protein [Nesterenkonia natronophila]
MRVVISSAGRRVYLVHWFQQALMDAEISGDVWVLDHDHRAAAAAAADGFRHMPGFTSEEYVAQLLTTVEQLKPDLFISLNDHELTALSRGLSADLEARGVMVPVLNTAAHRAVADKFHMFRVLRDAGIATPTTVQLSDVSAVTELLETFPSVVLKDRWGSGSSGLRRLSSQEARRWLGLEGGVGSDRSGQQRQHELIMQPDLGGSEYGIDIVAPVQGGAVAGVLARRKLSMRHGETSAAITVESGQFEDLAASLAETLNIRGTVDIDVMVPDGGEPQVIDINPRFGGGYPFNHIAGADVPHFLVTSTLGLAPQQGWNTYRHGHLGAKHEGIIGFDTPGLDAHRGRLTPDVVVTGTQKAAGLR